jgi:Tfp pilus assembly protein PilF
MRVTRWTAGAALLLWAAAGAMAAEKRWLRASSENFELFTTAGERSARDAIVHFERARSFFIRATGSAPASRRPVRIVAFSSDKEYSQYRPVAFASAFAVPGIERDLIVMKSLDSQFYRVAIHEYVHLLMRTRRGRQFPLWLDEGVAELYSTLRPSRRKMAVGHTLPGRMITLRSRPWLDLETLLGVDRRSSYYTERERAEVFYAQSWALTHMLMLDERYREKFPALLAALRKGDQKAAFEQTYERTLDQVWADLLKYVQRAEFNIGIFDVELPKSAEEPEIREATALERGLALANALAAGKRWEEARRAFVELAAASPERPEAEEEFGYAALRERQIDLARERFARAVKLGSSNAPMYVDYAGLLHLGGAQPAELTPLYRKAADLDPSLDDAHQNLGFCLVKEGAYAEAVHHFALTRKIEPEEAFNFFAAASYAYERLNRLPDAIQAMEKAKEHAQNPAETEKAGRTLARLRRQEGEAQTPQLVMGDVKKLEGRLERVDCAGKSARLRVRAGGKLVRIAMPNPSAVILKGAAGATAEFTCGLQQPARKVAVTYAPEVDRKQGTIGVVKILEFQ